MKKQLKISVILSLFLIGAGACNFGGGDPSEVWAGSFNDVETLVHETKKSIVEISPDEAHALMEQTGDFYLIDIREKDEFDAGSIPGAVFIPRGLLEFKIAKDEFWTTEGAMKPGKDYKIIVYCKTGGRAALAASSLMQLGYTDVASLQGGYKKWISEYPDEVYPIPEDEYIIEVEEVIEPTPEPVKQTIEVQEVNSKAEEGC